MLSIFRSLFAPPRHMILLVLAAWVGLSLAEKRAERHGIGTEELNNITFFGIIAFVIGGRISFALQNIASFMKSPLSLFSINPDLFDSVGALVTAALVTFVYSQRRHLSLGSLLDALTPFFAVIAVGLGFSHLAAGTAFGTPTNLPWGIELWNATRHPTQVYEILASLLTFLLLWFKRPNPHPGVDFLTFAALTAAWSLFIQAFRGDSTLVANGLREGQIFAWIVLAVCFVLLEVRLNTQPKRGREETIGEVRD